MKILSLNRQPCAESMERARSGNQDMVIYLLDDHPELLELAACNPEELEPYIFTREDIIDQFDDQQSTIPAARKTFDDYLEIVELPAGYIVTKNGVWVEKVDQDGNIKKVRISHAGILVIAIACTEKLSHWMHLIIWIDLDGHLRESLFPSESITSSKGCIAHLLSRGCRFQFDQHAEIKTYLSTSRPYARYRLVQNTGIYTSPDGSDQFALPAQIIGNSQGEEIYFQTDSSSNNIRQIGKLTDWQEDVATTDRSSFI